MTATLGNTAGTPEPALDRAEPDPTRSLPWRRRRWLVASLAATVVAALGVGGWSYAATRPSPYITVPVELLGVSVTDAGAALVDAGLVVTTVEVFDLTAPVGEVLRVDPAEGTSILRDETVTLTVSKGPDMRDVTVDAVGMALEDAEEALTAAGFYLPPTEYVYSDTIPAGTVISVTGVDGEAIELGDSFPVGTKIIMTCSDGLQPVTIPSVVGLAREDAITALTDLGLVWTEDEAYSPDVPTGVVAAQSPVADTAGHRLDSVNITVSKGPEPPPPPPAGVVIPSSVVGMTKFPALDLLSSRGFDARYERNTCTVDWAQCVVASTVPAAGTRQPRGSTVTIWLTNPAGVDTSAIVIPAGVVGMAKHPALDLLSSTGFNASYERNTCTVDWAECVVEYTVPAAGTTQPYGSTVTIWLRDPA